LDPEIRARIIGVIADRLDVRPEALTPETSLVDDLEADSLDLADLALTLEEHFAIRIPEEDIPQMLTIGAAEIYLSKRLEGHA